MAAVNSVQGALRLPLAGLAPPRVLMCSASMGAEGSVTLQLREAVQAPDSGASLDAALTIGYPDPEMLADMLGTLQAAGASDATSFNIVENKETISPSLIKTTNSSTIIKTEKDQFTIIKTEKESVHKSTSTHHSSSNSNSSTSSGSNLTDSSVTTTTTTTTSANLTTSATTVTSPVVVKKSRPKTASPTRHGPQQCQVCSKVFGNASALAKHKLTHSDERKYVCAMCSKAFKRQDHLNGHMLTHRNKKPYECKAEGCGKSYCDARSLRRHTENHHSTLATTPSTPNQLVTSTGPPTGLSLSPATANGDASSPHGATLIQYPHGDGSNSKSPSPSSPAGAGNEGLTRQQLDLISQIMQQTKQANANITAVAGQRPPQRPRTWNMQTQLQQTQSKLITNPDSPSSALVSMNGQNIQKAEQKPVECNLCHRKFKNIPALNGHMRLHGGYFKKDSETKKCDKKETPGPPLQTASVGVRALIEEKIISKRGKELKGAFVVPAPPLAARRITDIDNFKTPGNSTATNGLITTSNGTVAVTIAQPPTTTISTGLHIGTSTTIQKTTALSDNKDATLIELLKRGTKVAVKRTCSDPGGQIQNATVMTLPSGTSMSNPATPTSTPPLALSLTGTDTPLALTISQAPSGSGDVFTLAYSTDNSAAAFFGDNDVYGVPDTAMLLQAVDTIQLLHDTSASDQLDDIASLSDYTLSENTSLSDTFTQSRQLQAVLNSPLPESLAEFSTLHSKDYVLYGCTSTDSPTTQSSNSPLPSPLAYPTPPASHEGVAQASPFLDDSHHFSDASSFFDDKRNTNFLDENSAQSFFKESGSGSAGKSDCEMTENEKILKLKNELFNESKSVLMDGNSYYQNQKTLLNDNNTMFHTKIDLQNGNPLQINSSNFNNQNLSFLDEPQYLDDGRNTSSPLSAAFFAATMSSAEEVKEALEEVLPNDENTGDNDIDLYYLPSLSLQSQMMPNSDDPLLSSSPKDFSHHKQQKFDFTLFNPPSAKKPKLLNSNCDDTTTTNGSTTVHQSPLQSIATNCQIQTQSSKVVTIRDPVISSGPGHHHISNSKIPLTIHTTQEQIIPTKDSEVFLSPISITSTTSSSSSIMSALSPRGAIISAAAAANKATTTKKRHAVDKFRQYIKFQSSLRKSSSGHFTPTPILDPQRMSSGLFSTVNPRNTDLLDMKDLVDVDCYTVYKPKINVGSDYQAIVPNIQTSFEFYHPRDLLTWDPTIVKDEKALRRFIDLSKSSAIPLGTHSEETALKTLLEAQGEIHIAILQLLQSPSTEPYQRWASQEMDTFLHGLEIYGKDFYKISQEIPNKSTSECVQLYYFWKKLCLNYKSTHLKSTCPSHYAQQDSINNNNSNNTNNNPRSPTPEFYDLVNTIDPDTDTEIGINQPQNHHQNPDVRPHVCEMPDCSASFTSKAALLGHTRIHCIGRSINSGMINGLVTPSNNEYSTR